RPLLIGERASINDDLGNVTHPRLVIARAGAADVHVRESFPVISLDPGESGVTVHPGGDILRAELIDGEIRLLLLELKIPFDALAGEERVVLPLSTIVDACCAIVGAVVVAVELAQ